MPDIKRILHSLECGDAKAADELLPLVYDELRKLAAHRMSLQPPGQTLQATALVHEAYLRLLGNEEKRWENLRHFFSAAAEAMRHILIDRARRGLRVRHGEKAEKVPLDEIEIAAPAREEIVLQIDEALQKLAERSPEQDVVTGIAVNSGGNVFVTGGSWNGSNLDYTTIKYSSSIPSLHLDFRLLNNQLVLSWTNAGFNLQSAPAVTGTFTNLPGATSAFTNALIGPQQFFRLKEE